MKLRLYGLILAGGMKQGGKYSTVPSHFIGSEKVGLSSPVV